MELSDLGALSELLGRRVVDRAGRRLGRVYEARAHREGDGTIVIDELIVGRTGLARRLRGPGPDARSIPWEAVVDLGEERIEVELLR